jgi:hypothetical protein
MNNFGKNQGQSLVEAVAAIGILLMVVSVILALTVANIAGQKTSEFQIIANNLSREGIEVVRNIRDSNWLAGNSWDDGLSVAVLDANNETIIVFEDKRWQLRLPDNDSLYISDLGIYNSIGEGVLSSFTRRITLDNICINDEGEETIKKQPCNQAEDEIKIGLKISSQAKWFERGRQKSLVLVDLIYDWK